MNYLILGCGYVGSAVATAWKKENKAVVATTTSPAKIGSLQAQFGQAVVCHGNDAKTLAPLLAQAEVLLVTVATGSNQNYTEAYLETAQTLKKLLATNHSVRQLIYTSSTSVYGEHHGHWVSETTLPNPQTEQARLLLATEEALLSTATPQRAVCILRLGEIYGPGRTLEERMQQIAGKKRAGTGHSFTNFIHLEDISGAIQFAEHQQLNGLYNLVNETHLSRADFYAIACQNLSLPAVQWDPARPSVHAGNKRVSNTKIKAAGYVFQHPETRLYSSVK